MKKPTKGKRKWSLLGSVLGAVENVVAVLEHGYLTYGLESWKKEEPGLYLDALWRHLSKHTQGEPIDESSGLPHLAHVICNALFIIQAELNEAKNTERIERRGSAEASLSGSSADRATQPDQAGLQLWTKSVWKPRQTPPKERLAEEGMDSRCPDCGKPLSHLEKYRSAYGFRHSCNRR